MNNNKLFQTPGGLSIAHLSKAETAFAYKEIFEDKVYLRHGIELHDGDCVFDVGANIGLFSIYVHENFRDIKTFSFEPSPEVFPVLRTNLAKYGDIAVALPIGLSDSERQATFTYYPSYSIMSGFHASESDDRAAARAVILNQWHDKFPGQENPEDRFIDELIDGMLGRKTEYVCKLRTLSDVLHETQVGEISLLKIDTEGSEMEILAGISPSHWPQIRQIVMEVHNADPTRLNSLRQILASHGFDCFVEEEAQFRSTGICNCFARRP